MTPSARTLVADLRGCALTLTLSQGEREWLRLRPLRELVEAQVVERLAARAARRLVAARLLVVVHDQVRQELGDGEALVLPVRDRLQETGANVLPVVLRHPAALRAENALKQDGPVARLERLVQAHVPAGRRVQRIDHGLVA